MLEVCSFFKVIKGDPVEPGFIVESCFKLENALKDYSIFCPEYNRSNVRTCIEGSLKNNINRILKMYDEKPELALNYYLIVHNSSSFTSLYLAECGGVKGFLEMYGSADNDVTTNEEEKPDPLEDTELSEKDNEEIGFRKGVFKTNNANLQVHSVTAFGVSDPILNDNESNKERLEEKKDPDENLENVDPLTKHEDLLSSTSEEKVTDNEEEKLPCTESVSGDKQDLCEESGNESREEKQEVMQKEEEKIAFNPEMPKSAVSVETKDQLNVEEIPEIEENEPLQVVTDTQNMIAHKYYSPTGRFMGVDEEALLDSLKELKDLDTRIALDTLNPDYVLTEEQLIKSADVVNSYGAPLFKAFFLHTIMNAKDDRERIRVSALLDDFVNYVNER